MARVSRTGLVATALLLLLLHTCTGQPMSSMMVNQPPPSPPGGVGVPSPLGFFSNPMLVPFLWHGLDFSKIWYMMMAMQGLNMGSPMGSMLPMMSLSHAFN